MQAATEGRKRPCGRTGLCVPLERLENDRVDVLAWVVYASEKKMSVWMSWPVYAAAEAKKRLRGWQSLVDYVSEKKMSVWTNWPVWAATEARKRLRG